MTNLAEALARRIREKLGPFNDHELPVTECVANLVSHAYRLRSACQLGIDMMAINDLDLPKTVETMRDAINDLPKQSAPVVKLPDTLTVSQCAHSQYAMGWNNCLAEIVGLLDAAGVKYELSED